MKLSDINPLGRGSNRAGQAENDLGFGNRIGTDGERLINRDGSYNILRRGNYGWRPYQSLVEMPWLKFLGLITLFYFFINGFFAIIYLLIGIENLSGVTVRTSQVDNFFTAFFFSVQTFTTVGYGAISPVGAISNLIASFNALVGLLSFALATGLLFARFAKPKANIIFSKQAVVRPYRDTPYQSFQFQVVNSRNNRITNLEAKVAITWIEQNKQKSTRHFSLLELEREKLTLFPLNWVIVHIINNDSPVWKWTKQDYFDKQAEVIVLLKGFDETYSQDVNANSSYTCYEVRWNMRFERIYYAENGHTVIELDRVHTILPLEEEE